MFDLLLTLFGLPYLAIRKATDNLTHLENDKKLHHMFDIKEQVTEGDETVEGNIRQIISIEKLYEINDVLIKIIGDDWVDLLKGLNIKRPCFTYDFYIMPPNIWAVAVNAYYTYKYGKVGLRNSKKGYAVNSRMNIEGLSRDRVQDVVLKLGLYQSEMLKKHHPNIRPEEFDLILVEDYERVGNYKYVFRYIADYLHLGSKGKEKLCAKWN